MEKVVFVDHRQSSVLNSGSAGSLLTKDLFAISFEFAAGTNEDNAEKRKRRRPEPDESTVSDWLSDETLEAKLKEFVKTNSQFFAPRPQSNDDVANEAAKAAAASCPSAYFFQGCQTRCFSNDSEKAKFIVFQNREFVLPPNSCGLLGTLGGDTSSSHILEAAENLYKSKGSFNLIVMDPPWINKSVKRQRRYMTGSSEDILSTVSIDKLLAENGVVVIWYTHNESHYQQLKKRLDEWNLRILANWTWLKVTTSGSAICPFGRNFKKPYEHLLLAARPGAKSTDELIGSDGTILVSVPSAVHSHKPNLDNLLEKLLGIRLSDSRCLELFARSLKSNWICAGNEVLKLQCTSLFGSE